MASGHDIDGSCYMVTRRGSGDVAYKGWHMMMSKTRSLHLIGRHVLVRGGGVWIGEAGVIKNIREHVFLKLIS